MILRHMLIVVAALSLTGCWTRECDKQCASGEEAKEAVVFGIGLGCDCVSLPSEVPEVVEPVVGSGGRCDNPQSRPPPYGTLTVGVRSFVSGMRVEIHDPVCNVCTDATLFSDTATTLEICRPSAGGKGEFSWRQKSNSWWVYERFLQEGDEVHL